MRVIAGSAGGIRLAVPKRGVRPTMDRVKAAIFSSLGDIIAGARVLDLFAGSGALGIEALSRGASSVVLFTGLFREDDSSRRLPRKVRSTPGNLRWWTTASPAEARIDMAACGQRWGSKYRVETGPCIARSRARVALRPDHNHYNWVRT